MVKTIIAVEEFFESVIKDLGYKGWRIKWDGDPWCQGGKKVLHMSEEDTEIETKHLLLHEIAHIEIMGHDEDFWNHYEYLLGKYLGEDLNAFNEKMKADYLGASR